MPEFSQSGALVTVPAGAGYLGTQPTVLVSDTIPSGVQAFIESLTCRALDVDVTQIRFALRRNGASPSEFASSMQASMFISTATLPIRESMPPGVVSIVAYNLSGTGLPNAGPAVSPLCQAGWYGSYDPLPKTAPLPFTLWSLFPKRYWKVGLCLALSLGISHYEKSFAQSLVVPGSTTARSALPIACVNQTTFLLESCGGGSGLTDAQLRATPVPVSGTVTVTDGVGALNVIVDSGSLTTVPPANASTNVTQFGSNAVVTGTGIGGVGIPRVTLSNDSSLAANQSVNLAQVAGTTTVNGGLVGSLSVGGTSANNTAINQNPILVGCESLTYGTQPTASTTGNLRRIPCTTEGAIAVTPGHNRFSCFVQAATVTTQCQAAPGAGLRAYILSVSLDNQAATVQTLDIVFGTGAACVTGITALTHKWQFGTLATTTSPFNISHTFNSPLVPTAANAICVRPTAATSFGATITGYIAP